jgi:hypothetical protein
MIKSAKVVGMVGLQCVRFASVAQMVEQRFRKPPVGGSSPLAGSRF